MLAVGKVEPLPIFSRKVCLCSLNDSFLLYKRMFSRLIPGIMNFDYWTGTNHRAVHFLSLSLWRCGVSICLNNAAHIWRFIVIYCDRITQYWFILYEILYNNRSTHTVDYNIIEVELYKFDPWICHQQYWKKKKNSNVVYLSYLSSAIKMVNKKSDDPIRHLLWSSFVCYESILYYWRNQ